MNGRVLSEEELNHFQPVNVQELDLIATIRDLQAERDIYKQQMEYWRSSSDQFANNIRDRDKTIAELRKVMSDESAMWRSRELWKKSCEDAEKQNAIMLEALERIFPPVSDMYGWFDDCTPKEIVMQARDTIAQVKALPVSRQGE